MTTATQTNGPSTNKSPTSNKYESGAPFTDSAREQAHQMIDKVAERGSVAEKNLRSAAEKSGDKVTETQQKAKESLDSSIETVKRLVQDYPFATAGAVFAAGILFSAWVRRR
jgi:flagellar hook-basal body complex protein FliE